MELDFNVPFVPNCHALFAIGTAKSTNSLKEKVCERILRLIRRTDAASRPVNASSIQIGELQKWLALRVHGSQVSIASRSSK